ncbi:SDR family oxidoreductase [Candidatus Pacearchaeota archaeon]|nr:SDR family oxidoreductase [Candidatus Pacearchaeota archaeon]
MKAAKNPYFLEDKTMLITGSSRGIGAATARLAKQYGAEVILHGRTESEPLKLLAKELDSKYIFCDAADEKAVKKAVGNLEVEVLVNNAGINPSKTFMDLTGEDWKRIYDVNVFGPVYFSQAVIPRMLERGQGKIINISSAKSHNHVRGKPAYASAKAALNRLTTSMAEEFAPHILVNAVAPGFADTEMVEKTLSPVIRAQIDNIPLKRMASADEMAETVLFLASDKANYITGHVLSVDGGFSIVSG